MRLFWIFLGLATAIILMEIFYVPGYLVFISSLVFLGIAVVIFINNYRLAKANFTVQLEKKQLEGMIISLQDGVVAYDPNFKVMVFNRAAEEVFKIKAEEVLGKDFTPQRASDARFKLMAQVMFPSLAPVVITRSEAGVFPQVVDLSLLDPVLELRVTTVKILDDKNTLLGFMKIVRNRTREIEAAHSKSEFVTVAAHQLRTPLNAISWTFESLAGEEKIPTEFKEIINNGKTAAVKLLETVNDLLDVAKIEEGKFGYQMEDVEFVSFMEQILAQHLVAVKQHGIALYFNRPEEKGLVLRIDKQRMVMAINNIVENAIKYNVKNGEVRIALEKIKNEPFVKITVADTGIGIPPDEIGKLFKKFFRATNVLKFQTEGTGLGLYMARNIIRQHGGQIWAESTLNRGTTFYFTLPTNPSLVPIKEVFVEE